MNPLAAVRHELHHRKDELLGRVERVQDLVFRHRDGLGVGNAPLDLDKAQLARGRVAALDVVAKLLKLPIHRREAQAALDRHDDRPRSGGGRLCVGGMGRRGQRSPREQAEQADGHDHQPAHHDRRQRRDLRL